MSRPISIHNHPFRFLLYLEWILLSFAALSAIIPPPFPRSSIRFTELTICTLVIFGLMGLRLPQNNQFIKVIYTATEIFLIVITRFFGGITYRIFPFLYLILVTRSCLIFQMQGRLVITVLSFIFFLLTLKRRFDRIPISPAEQERFLFFSFNFAVMFGLALIFVLLLMNTVLSERKSREELAIANEKLRQVSAMRSHPLQEQSLEQATVGLAENMQRAIGVSPICKIDLADSISSEITTPIYRIIQESFTNICKHSQATEVTLELTTTDTHLHLIIKDNGRGFELGQNTTGFGLKSMRDRTLALGGKFNINSTPENGCQIIVEIPLMSRSNDKSTASR
ncbi:MAG: sensor histidine kinase [Chlorogloeopsis fritschii C42_A2020_084]|uniref:sensor histidine kinase n=1 Tax=Chlorogloeopsis fritschii TaxID=1124 RepID=UPI001A04196B|nr:ATP-binding protein [Chlorogloeopsis fritschii]MBF2004087.1 sensor histidine kinase [Chlorogloeopsis fritschii C42_A2020_084]